VAGVDALWQHWPGSPFEIGLNAEQRLLATQSGDDNARRGVVFGRYVFQYGDSLYLPPMHYAEAFVKYQDNFLPNLHEFEPGGERFARTATAGLHYRIDYLTPYWDPEGGFRFDAVYENGVADLTAPYNVEQLAGQFSFVKSAPDLTGLVGADVPVLGPA